MIIEFTELLCTLIGTQIEFHNGFWRGISPNTHQNSDMKEL